jgi:membrane protein required for colicin V production
MNSFDVVLILVLVSFIAVGVLRGMVREIMSFATWIVATAVGWLFASEVEGHFKKISDEYALRMVLAFVALFAATWLLGLLTGLLVQRFVARRRGLNLPNLLVGGAIGLARGVVLIVIAFLFAGITSIPQRPWWRESAVAPYFEKLASQAAGYLPSDVARHIRYG